MYAYFPYNTLNKWDKSIHMYISTKLRNVKSQPQLGPKHRLELNKQMQSNESWRRNYEQYCDEGVEK